MFMLTGKAMYGSLPQRDCRNLMASILQTMYIILRILRLSPIILFQHYFEDRDGKIWIGTLKGLDVFNKEDGVFFHHEK